MKNESEIELHKAALAQINDRRAEIAEEEGLLDGAESYHHAALLRLGYDPARPTLLEIANRSHTNGETATAATLEGLTRHDAAVIALEKLGQAASVPEITDWLRERNYGKHVERQMFAKGLRTCLERKPDLFTQAKQHKWRLTKWAGESPEKT